MLLLTAAGDGNGKVSLLCSHAARGRSLLYDRVIRWHFYGL